MLPMAMAQHTREALAFLTIGAGAGAVVTQWWLRKLDKWRKR